MASNGEEPPSKVQKLDEKKEPDFSSPNHFSDVVLIVEGRKFHVHKSVLSLSSPVFETMFTSSFHEGKAKEISLPGKKADEFEVFLNVIYSFKSVYDEYQVDDDNYKFLLQLADEYQVQKIKDHVHDHISNEGYPDDPTLAFELYNLTNCYGLDEDAENSLKAISQQSVETIESHQWYKDLNDNVKIQILKKRIDKLESLIKDFAFESCNVIEGIYFPVVKMHSSFNDYLCSNRSEHTKQKQRTFRIETTYEVKKFDAMCKTCADEADSNWPKASDCEHMHFTVRYSLLHLRSLALHETAKINVSVK